MGRLRTQLAAMLAQATGGPQRYDGPDVATIHRDMKITGTEFDAFVEDLRAALREREVRSREAGELIGLVEAMKGDVVHR
jgi:hemoglobin